MSPCNCDKNKINLSLIDDVLDEYAAVPGSLITILQKHRIFTAICRPK